jgi:hypothetical protein
MTQFGEFAPATTNATDYFIKKRRDTEPELLDADMRPSDIVDTLRRLKFNDEFGLVELDRAERDYLIAALTDTRRK